MIVGLRGEVYRDEVHLIITSKTEHKGNQARRFFRLHHRRRWYMVDEKHGDTCVLVNLMWVFWLEQTFRWLVWQPGGVSYHNYANYQHGKVDVEKMIGG